MKLMSVSSRHIFIAFIALMSVFCALVVSTEVRANPDQFLTSATATATTTVAFLTSGVSTSSVAFDGMSDAGLPVKSAAILLQFTGSSSALSILNVNLQYAQGTPGVDCVANQSACDWYEDSVGAETSLASTSPSLTNPVTFSLTFSSSTRGQAVATNGNSTVNTKEFSIDTPTRYVRAVYSLAPGSLNGAVWAQFVAKKEIR